MQWWNLTEIYFSLSSGSEDERVKQAAVSADFVFKTSAIDSHKTIISNPAAGSNEEKEERIEENLSKSNTSITESKKSKKKSKKKKKYWVKHTLILPLKDKS